MSEIKNQVEKAFDLLFDAAKPEKGDILVVGCSTSEVLGEKIGTAGSLETANEIFSALKEKCCEHLNRALVLEKELALKKNLTIVCAVPHEHAGGSLATAAYRGFKDPVLVESISAQLGMDIGLTLIGMHLQSVAVPVRTEIKRIGNAPVVFARTRPKYIGGERAQYR